MRLWSKREQDSEEFDIPAPDGIERILEYSLKGGQVPTGVTIAGGETISSRRVDPLQVREPGDEWVAL